MKSKELCTYFEVALKKDCHSFCAEKESNVTYSAEKLTAVSTCLQKRHKAPNVLCFSSCFTTSTSSARDASRKWFDVCLLPTHAKSSSGPT